jgi:hypothetical protein
MVVSAPGSHCNPEYKQKDNQLEFKHNVPQKQANVIQHILLASTRSSDISMLASCLLSTLNMCKYDKNINFTFWDLS